MVKVRTKLALVFFLLNAAGVAFFVYQLVGYFSPRYREAVEEQLIDSAELVAALVASDPRTTFAPRLIVDTESLTQVFTMLRQRALDAQVYKARKTHVDLRLSVTDATGRVLFDSNSSDRIGADDSRWNNIVRTLGGGYGARTTRDTPSDPTTTVLYVSAPVVHDGEIVGVVTVGKPGYQVNRITEESKRQVWGIALLLIGGSALIIVLASYWISLPLARLAAYARSIGTPRQQPAPRPRESEIADVLAALEDMRIRLEGKQYVERYLRTITHEVKSPLSGIRGAAEILAEHPAREAHDTFVCNILRESGRIEGMIEALLKLSTLQQRSRLEDTTRIPVRPLLEEVRDLHHHAMMQRGVHVRIDAASELHVHGERGLLLMALSNLLKNAIDFTPTDGSIDLLAEADGETILIAVRDTGAGIPAFAEGRLFDPFFSLPRPDGSAKSSGIGLAIVREVVELHGGAVTIRNREGGGVIAEVRLRG